MEAMNPYLSYPPIQEAIQQHNPYHPGRDLLILGIWNNILASQFPVTHGFLITPREHGWNNERDLWFDLQVQHVSSSIHMAFLVVICRTASQATNGHEGIQDWIDHLEMYLDMIFGPRRRGGHPVRVFGGIVYRRTVAFYSKVVGGDSSLTIMPEHIDMNKAEFDILEDQEIIQEVLTSMNPLR